MQSFIELLKDHTLILSTTNKLLAIVDGSEPEPAAAFDALRRLSAQLDAHLRAEDNFIRQNDDLGHEDFVALAAEHGEKFDDLVSGWSTFLREWTEETIAEDWQTFAFDTRHILARLNEQVEAENQTLYPAALKYGLIRLVPAGDKAAA